MVSGFLTALAALLGAIYQFGIVGQDTPGGTGRESGTPSDYHSGASGPSSGSQQPRFTDVCMIEGTQILIAANDAVYPSGRRVPPANSMNCSFDIVGPHARYCVTPDGTVLAKDPTGRMSPVGQCTPCGPGQCP